MYRDNVYSNYKSGRILYLYTKLINGEAISKAEEAERFGVNKRSIQRDFDELRMFFENQFIEGKSNKKLVYDRGSNSYQLIEEDSPLLSNSEIYVICKILLESRSLCKDDMDGIINKLVELAVPKKNKSAVKTLIANEMLHYIEPRHKKHFIENIWEIGIAVRECSMININYLRQDGRGTTVHYAQLRGTCLQDGIHYSNGKSNRRKSLCNRRWRPLNNVTRKRILTKMPAPCGLAIAIYGGFYNGR